MRRGLVLWGGLVAMLLCLMGADAQIAPTGAATGNLIANADFRARASNGVPAGYELSGSVEYRYMGDPRREVAGWGVALKSSGGNGTVAQRVDNVDPGAGRWMRFSVRGLPQEHFAADDLYLKVEFFGDHGRTAMDGVAKHLGDLVALERKDLSVNGDRRARGAATWRAYQMDFRIPFPQVDEVRVSVGFTGGKAHSAADSDFLVTDWSLVRIADQATTQPADEASAGAEESKPGGTLIALGGRWFYEALPGEERAPSVFDVRNVDRLLYHAGGYEAPFAGNTTAWLRAGDKDVDGNIVRQDRFVPDNVTISFDATTMIVHAKGLPNHPTGKFPEAGIGPHNPNYIQEHRYTYYIPLDPQQNPDHVAMDEGNNDRALPMGAIGIAVNGVVFYNPFDMGMQDATDMMDQCCGHPSQDNRYHYHKYPICVNSPWADEGKAHSPVIGWAFDGFAIYGPYESDGVMAKDVTGEGALNDFNIGQDKDRGWHYHVTPGKFPYVIGGFWGTEDARDRQRPPRMGNGGGNGAGNRNGGPPNGMPPPMGGGPPGGGPPGGPGD